MSTEVDAEFLGEEGQAVSGTSRMEAAYGSGDGDEELTAQVAQSGVVAGTIFDTSYRPWRGEFHLKKFRCDKFANFLFFLQLFKFFPRNLT